MGRNKSHPPLTEEQKNYILSSYQEVTVLKMSEEMEGVSAKRIYKFLADNGLPSLEMRNKKDNENKDGFFSWDGLKNQSVF